MELKTPTNIFIYVFSKNMIIYVLLRQKNPAEISKPCLFATLVTGFITPVSCNQGRCEDYTFFLVRGALYTLMGVFTEQFPDIMEDRADRLLVLYLSCLKQEMEVIDVLKLNVF